MVFRAKCQRCWIAGSAYLVTSKPFSGVHGLVCASHQSIAVSSVVRKGGDANRARQAHAAAHRKGMGGDG